MASNPEFAQAVESEYVAAEHTRHYADTYPGMPDRLRDIVRWLDTNLKSAGLAFMLERIDTQVTELQAKWAKVYALTPAETRLAAHLVHGGTLASFAKARALSRNTARNQLQSIYCKTGTHRQAELVSLLLKA
ncbi:MAG: hypothetical protein K8S25_15375 [Alphaproteobacteria bacterium]|nr:hypothetical protein [Alphaproteobacteria bacterium]